MAPFLRVPAGIRYRVEGELLLLQEQHKPGMQRSEIGGGEGPAFMCCTLVKRLAQTLAVRWRHKEGPAAA